MVLARLMGDRREPNRELNYVAVKNYQRRSKVRSALHVLIKLEHTAP